MVRLPGCASPICETGYNRASFCRSMASHGGCLNGCFTPAAVGGHPQVTLDLGTELAQPVQAGVRATRSSDGRRSGKEERCLDAAFQDLLRACNVWHGARELESSHHESEDGCRPTTGCSGIGFWE